MFSKAKSSTDADKVDDNDSTTYDILSQARNQKFFKAVGHFNKHFVKNTRKKDPAGQSFVVSSPSYSQNYILSGKFNKRMDKSESFFPKSGHVFRFSKKSREGIPPRSLVARLCPLSGILPLKIGINTILLKEPYWFGLGNQRFQFWFRLLTMCRGELSVVIDNA